MNPVKIWGDEDLMLKHFFQIIQTKHLYADVVSVKDSKDADTWGAGGPKVVACVGSEEELIKLAKIIKMYVDGGTELQLYVIYCGYDHLLELCKSKESSEHIQLEMKTLEYKFSVASSRTHCGRSHEEDDVDVVLSGSCTTELDTAANYLSKDACATEKIFSVEPSKQRKLILDMMIPLAANNYMGYISWGWESIHPMFSSVKDCGSGSSGEGSDSGKTSVKKCGDVLMYDLALSPENFVSCLVLF